MPALLDWSARALGAQWLVLSALYAAYALAQTLLPDARRGLRWAATAVGGIWLLTTVFHLLMALRLFTLTAGLLAIGSAALAAHVACRERVLASWRGDLEALGALLWTRGRPGRAAAVALVAAMLVGFAARAASVPVLSWDSLTYHAVKAGLWVQGAAPIGWDAPGGWSIYRTYLGGGEVLWAWAMLPFHADTLAGLADALVWLGLGVAACALAEEIELPRRVALGAALYVLAIPAVARTVGSLYIDNTTALLLVAGCALALHAVRRLHAPAAALALTGLGCAAGVKIFAAPVAAVLGAALAIALLRRRRTWTTAGWLAGGSIGAALATAPWLWRTWRLTGHPLSPLPVNVGPFELGTANAAMRWYMDRPDFASVGFADEWTALGRMLGLPWLVAPIEPTLGPFLLLPLALAVPGFVILARRRPWAATLIAALVLPPLLAFYGEGMHVTRLRWAAVSGRYLIAVVAAVVVVAAVPLRGRRATAYAAALAVAAALHLFVNDLQAWRGADFAVAAVAVASAAVAAAAIATIRAGWGRALAATVLGIVLVVGLHGYRERRHAVALERTTVLHELPRYWIPAALLPEVREGRRTIAVTAGPWQDADNWLVYHFLGRRLQNHLTWISPIPGNRELDMRRYREQVAQADYATWRTALLRQDVTDVLSFAPQSIELAWMEQHPTDFIRRAGDGRNWGLYAVRTSTASPP